MTRILAAPVAFRQHELAIIVEIAIEWHRLSVGDQDQAFGASLDQVAIVGHQDHRARIRIERRDQRGAGVDIEMIGRLVEHEEVRSCRAGKTEQQIVAEQTAGIDARFFCGNPDVSELPGAYKNAAAVRAQITEFGLAEIVDTIEPVGCIMAGDWQRDAPWRKKKAARKQ